MNADVLPQITRTFYRIKVFPSKTPDSNAFAWTVELCQEWSDGGSLDVVGQLASGSSVQSQYCLENARDFITRYEANPMLTEEVDAKRE